MNESAKRSKSMLGKWDSWYKDVKRMSSFRYGNTITYQLGEDFLSGMDVEDWGCGTGGFKRLHHGEYLGIDGSKNPFVDKIADLRNYKSSVDAVMMRHTLEHNYEWEKVLDNAISSFKRKFCLVLFTPFSKETKVIGQNKKYGVDVPTISFSRKDIERHFKGLKWKLAENIKTKTYYGIEHIYYVEKPKPKIAVITASLGGFDQIEPHVPQSVSYDYFPFTDENFPPRFNAMTPRLQAKIPKFFGWQMAPGYDYYLWIDANLTLTNPDSLKYFFDNCQNYDVVVLKHPGRPNIRQEVRYTRKGLNQQSMYMVNRYTNELLKEQYEVIESDKDYIDDSLVIGGVFMYRNIPEVHKMLKEWWYNVTRYIIQDQISFVYVLKKSGLKINVRPDKYNDCAYLRYKGHVHRAK